jgi:hypothetical protein
MSNELDAVNSFFQLGGWAVPPRGTVIRMLDRLGEVKIVLNGKELKREMYGGWRVVLGSSDSTEILVGHPDYWDIDSPNARGQCRWLSLEEDRYIEVVSLPLNAPPFETWPRPAVQQPAASTFFFEAEPAHADIITVKYRGDDVEEVE